MGKCVNLRPSHRRGATPSESPGRALAGSPPGPRGTWRAGAGASRRWGRGAAWDPAEGSRQPGIRLSRLRVRKLDPGATSARRSEGEPDGCGSRAPSAGPRPVPSHLWSACDTSVGILLPPQPPTSSASRPLRPSAAALLPLRRRSGSARPPAPPPWASPPSVARRRRCHPRSKLSAFAAPAPVPLRAALVRPPSPSVPVVWPPGRGGREQPEEEPQPGRRRRPEPMAYSQGGGKKKVCYYYDGGWPGNLRRGDGEGAAGRTRGSGCLGWLSAGTGTRPTRQRGRGPGSPSLLSGPPHGHAQVWGTLPQTSP